ncbi:signal peptide peptidase SppA [Methylobacterium sp. HMF5984]|uniref:signal peptide peptidase SppA n=1 Tax=unclassified Methylobacterium TaxID=2615210 RepID=UPI0011C8D454|nr:MULTISPECIES: signal peptide peptidase SppA [unclassified Methylobacterium]MCJ2007155.1 signal peptide peptidase SppA [Methylobacterium sp. J-092]MCJ2076629.1 signal peptide peptidase SppA [Methylobacterium sp. E-016]TXN70193.1 signal peptide peptidase SppA [Methylobacterium sp. WL6]
MAADAELLIDRRRLRRKLSLWRVVGIGGLVVAVGAVGLRVRAGTEGGLFGAVKPQIARISISGFISGSEATAKLMKRVGESAAVEGVVVSINSPGGTTTGSEELFRNLRALAEKKPIVAFVDGTAASGAYITAIAADHIVARETSLVGSIGVLFQYPDVSGLLDKVGVKVESVKSSPLKAEPSGFTPTSPEARAALAAVVGDTYAWFKNLVAERRGMDGAQVATVSDGRVFSGRQSVPLKLVDELGSERQAIAWLESARKVPKNLPVTDWKPASGQGFGLFSALGLGADLLGLDGLSARLAEAGAEAGAVTRGGMLVLWRPSPSAAP